MRTTLTIDDNLAGLLKRRAKKLDVPFKEVVNNALRQGMMTWEDTPAPDPTAMVRPHDFGALRPGIDPLRLNQLVDELEAEDFLQKTSRA